MKVQILKVAVTVVVLAGLAAGDTKVVTPYSFPGVVVVGQAPARAVSYVHHTAAVPSFRASTLHYTAPQAVQYAVPQAVRYTAPAVRYPLVYSATYHQPAAAVVKVSYDFDDDDDDVRPLTYTAGSSWDTSLEDDDDDDMVVSPYGRFDDDHFDIDDHDDRK
ncbi:uncharacterized protein LOC123508686 [Portunus trituberculatus]|uniref:uncharacterized protein LOC123508686 n=1 Tax=Portunus trituberculatus TaxID=210409 RepID=UPI001E1D0668|nr:uncharacterized protein LOC123508686 [Portunus trituberculatus]